MLVVLARARARGVSVEEYVDQLGNTVHHFDVLEQHDRLAVTPRSEVWTAPRPSTRHRPRRSTGATSSRRRGTSRSTTSSPSWPLPPGSADATDVAGRLMDAVRSAMTYSTDDPRPHDGRRGARRGARGLPGLSHVMIGACRARGIPARYVSGYLYDPKHGDLGESHAWVDVHLGERGWVSLDPTHDAEQPEHYVRVGVGRDYADVSPSRGVYKGTATRRSRSRSRFASRRGAYARGRRARRGRREQRDRVLERRERLPDRPTRAVVLADLVGDHPRTSIAGTRASAAARSTPNPSIPSTSGPSGTAAPAPPTAAEVWIGAVAHPAGPQERPRRAAGRRRRGR